MSPRARVAWLAITLTVAACGCGRASEMPRVGFPMAGGPTTEGFERLLSRARDPGYTIDFSDAAFGAFGVTARTPAGRRDPERATLVVQCHADGRATIDVVGTATDDRGHARVTPALRREVVRLAQELEEGRLEP